MENKFKGGKHGEFCNRPLILHAQVGSHHSQVWRAILEGRDVLVKDLICRIGNELSTEIWNYNWLPLKELTRPIVSLAADPPHLVRSY